MEGWDAESGWKLKSRVKGKGSQAEYTANNENKSLATRALGVARGKVPKAPPFSILCGHVTIFKLSQQWRLFRRSPVRVQSGTESDVPPSNSKLTGLLSGYPPASSQSGAGLFLLMSHVP